MPRRPPLLLALAVPALVAASGCRGKTQAPPPPSATASAPPPPSAASAAPVPPSAATVAKRVTDCANAFSRGDFDALGACYAEHAKGHVPDSGRPDTDGRGAIVNDSKKGFKTAFVDGKLAPQIVLVHGFDVVTTAVLSGTHTGPLLEPSGLVPPTKKAFGQRAFVATTVDPEGTIVEEWFVNDRGSLLAQLGQRREKGRPRSTQGIVNAPIVVASTGDASEASNVAVVTSGWQALAQKNLAGYAALLGDGVLLSDESEPADVRGKPGVLANADAFVKAFSKLSLECKRWGAGNYVASLCRVEAVNDGPHGKRAATNRPLSFTLAELVRLDAGLEQEIVRVFDSAHVDAALAVPAPAGSAQGKP
jgi:SnoaL-like polyketide cyclase